MPESIPQDDWLARKIGPAELDGIAGRVGPLAALCGGGSRALGLTSGRDDDRAAEDGRILELAAWDPAIAANILAAAAQRVATLGALPQSPASTSIASAVASLGRDAVWTIALASLGRRWPGEEGAWDRREFCRHCIAVSLAARMLAQGAGLPVEADEAGTWGLLHDLGKLGMFQVLPKASARVLRSLSAEGGGDLAAREQALLGVDHALFGRRMAQRWRLGEALTEAIWLHHLPLDTPALRGQTRLRAGLVQLADTLARELQLGFAGNSAFPADSAALAGQLDIPAQVLAGVKDELPGECRRLFDRLGLEGAGAPRGPAAGRLIETSIERLARSGLAMHEEAAVLKARATAMDCLARFLDARRPEESLSDTLVGLAALAADAMGLHPSPERPVAAYAIDADAGSVLAVRLAGAEKPSARTLRLREPRPGEVPAGAPEALGEPAAGAMEQLLEDPSELGGWLDLSSAAHVPLARGGRRVGGLLLAGLLPADAGAVLSLLAGAAGHWLALCLELRRASARGEQWAEACAHLASEQEALAQAKALSAVGEMAASAAHEINNPLAVISGRAQLMLARAAGEEEKKACRLLVEESQRISDILTSLVELSRPPRPQLAAAAPADLLAEAARAFRETGHPQADAVRVDIQTAGSLPAVRADRGQMAAVLRELLANAVAAGARRVVLAAAESPEGGVVLSVADDGSGMDAATRAAAFTPLFSGQQAGRRKGLGLAKARAAVEAHGGSIWIRSEPGKGTTVFVRLPAARE